MDYRIADAVSGQADGIERLEGLCFSVPWTREQILSQLPDGEHIMLTAADPDDLVLGYAGAMLAADGCYISNVAVAPELRRSGIGGALVEELSARASGTGMSFVTLEVRESNAPARALYEKHGFKEVGVRKNYYEKPRENAIIMTLFLK